MSAAFKNLKPRLQKSAGIPRHPTYNEIVTAINKGLTETEAVESLCPCRVAMSLEKIAIVYQVANLIESECSINWARCGKHPYTITQKIATDRNEQRKMIPIIQNLYSHGWNPRPKANPIIDWI